MIDHFIIGGAQRSGTTFLYRMLDAHPEIQMAKPVRPEPKFFLKDDLFQGGRKLYEETCFGPPDPRIRVRGEKSTSYIEYESCARRIRAILPEVKLIFVLRNPVERAISNYWFSVNNGLENRPINEALAVGGQKAFTVEGSGLSASPYNYLGRGKYVDYLNVYRKYFPAEQLKIVLFEEMVAGGGVVYADLLSFLGLAPTEDLPDGLGPVNASEKHDIGLSEELRRELTSFFLPWNQRLKDEFQVNTDLWLM
ncbi:sulfotransferase domain-containing protein [Geothermobacter ehrlichii]|uniref:Sulfotransferase domain-containing protein n=1 Tax=Geothermobacter ehrlichii TaxID=213224 RepID=A0A5D3WJC0_9BACT|nr:sulfotransferase [Geothermobacter ehrlichii]TYO99023.1 sulfotransferase domain-containing protein [Geothermobacter ehrlichii]